MAASVSCATCNRGKSRNSAVIHHVRRVSLALADLDEPDPFEFGAICCQFKDGQVAQKRITCQVDVPQAVTLPSQFAYTPVGDSVFESQGQGNIPLRNGLSVESSLGYVSEMHVMQVPAEPTQAQKRRVRQLRALC